MEKLMSLVFFFLFQNNSNNKKKFLKFNLGIYESEYIKQKVKT